MLVNSTTTWNQVLTFLASNDTRVQLAGSTKEAHKDVRASATQHQAGNNDSDPSKQKPHNIAI